MNLSHQKYNVIKENHAKTETLARFITSDISRLLFGVEELIEGIHKTEEHIEDNHEHDEHIEDILKKDLRAYIMDILILSPQGEILHWTGEGKKPDIRDRQYFKYHLKQKKSLRTFIGQPQLSKVHPDKWFFALSKAYYTEKNELENIIVVIINLDYFKYRYKDDILNPNTTITIASSQGVIYTSYPNSLKLSGSYIQEIETFAKSNKSVQHYNTLSPLNQQQRIATLARSNTYPIISAVSLLKEDVLAPWEQQKKNAFVITLIIGVGFFILIFSYSKLQKELIALTRTDGLTKLYNRRYFEELSQVVFSRAKRHGEEVTIMMLDIDDFKQINDRFGHQEGDKVIESLAHIITEQTRSLDICGRYGGEEFIVLMDYTKESDALIVASRIKKEFEDLKKATVSIGIAQLHSNDSTYEDMIGRADKALYGSKESGRNQITLASQFHNWHQ